MKEKMLSFLKNKKIVMPISISIIAFLFVGIILAKNGLGMEFPKKEKEEKIDTGSTYGDLYATYLKENVLNEKEEVEVTLVNVDDTTDPEMWFTYEETEKEQGKILYIEEEKVKETKVVQNAEPTILYSVETSTPTWYLKEKTEKTYVPIKEMMKENVSDTKLEEVTIKEDESFTTNYVEADIALEEKKVTKNELNKTITDMVSDYKENNKVVTDAEEQKITEKITTIKEQKVMEDAKITASNSNAKIGEHIKYFVGAYRGADYGWTNVFKYKDVTGTITIPGMHDYEMAYEVVGLKSIGELNVKLEEYIQKDKIPTTYSIQKEFKEYNGKVYRVRGGIGDSDYFDLKKTKVLSSENGITKVKIFEYAAFGPEGVVAEVILTFTYNKDTGKYQITDWTSKNNY